MRVDTHIFGSFDGYRTIHSSEGIRRDEAEQLSEFGFGQTSSQAAMDSLASIPCVLGRGLRSGRIALTRAFAGQPDDAGRPTIELRTLVFEPSDFDRVRRGLRAIIDDDAIWARQRIASARPVQLHEPRPRTPSPAAWRVIDSIFDYWGRKDVVFEVPRGAAGEEAILGAVATVNREDLPSLRWGLNLLSTTAAADVCTLAPNANVSPRRQRYGLPLTGDWRHHGLRSYASSGGEAPSFNQLRLMLAPAATGRGEEDNLLPWEPFVPAGGSQSLAASTAPARSGWGWGLGIAAVVLLALLSGGAWFIYFRAPTPPSYAIRSPGIETPPEMEISPPREDGGGQDVSPLGDSMLEIPSPADDSTEFREEKQQPESDSTGSDDTNQVEESGSDQATSGSTKTLVIDLPQGDDQESSVRRPPGSSVAEDEIEVGEGESERPSSSPVSSDSESSEEESGAAGTSDVSELDEEQDPDGCDIFDSALPGEEIYDAVAADRKFGPAARLKDLVEAFDRFKTEVETFDRFKTETVSPDLPRRGVDYRDLVPGINLFAQEYVSTSEEFRSPQDGLYETKCLHVGDDGLKGKGLSRQWFEGAGMEADWFAQLIDLMTQKFARKEWSETPGSGDVAEVLSVSGLVPEDAVEPMLDRITNLRRVFGELRKPLQDLNARGPGPNEQLNALGTWTSAADFYGRVVEYVIAQFEMGKIQIKLKSLPELPELRLPPRMLRLWDSTDDNEVRALKYFWGGTKRDGPPPLDMADADKVLRGIENALEVMKKNLDKEKSNAQPGALGT